MKEQPGSVSKEEGRSIHEYFYVALGKIHSQLLGGALLVKYFWV